MKKKICVKETWWRMDTALSLALAGSFAYIFAFSQQNVRLTALAVFVIGYVLIYSISRLLFPWLLEKGEHDK